MARTRSWAPSRGAGDGHDERARDTESAADEVEIRPAGRGAHSAGLG